MGQGRNSIYLAQHGWDVTGFDPADEGIRLAKAEATRLRLKINAFTTTFEQFDFGENRWDLIVLTYEATKAIAPRIEPSLRRGGAVLVEDRHHDTLRVWPAGHTLGDNELLSLFANLRVLRYEDVWAPADWSLKKSDQRLVRVFAEKPLAARRGCLWDGKGVAEETVVCWQGVTLRCNAAAWRITGEKCAVP